MSEELSDPSDPFEYVNHNKFTFIMLSMFVIVIILMILVSRKN